MRAENVLASSDWHLVSQRKQGCSNSATGWWRYAMQLHERTTHRQFGHGHSGLKFALPEISQDGSHSSGRIR